MHFRENASKKIENLSIFQERSGFSVVGLDKYLSMCYFIGENGKVIFNADL